MWDSRTGNVHCSTLVRLRDGDPPATTLALVAGIALHACACEAAPDAPMLLKWPNDLMAGEAKVGGVLMERAGEAVVIGFGLNAGHAPAVPERKTAALVELGADPRIGPDMLVRALAEAFAAVLERWRRSGADAVIAEWLAVAHPIGTPLTATVADGERVSGRFAGLAPDGALRLQTGEGPPIEVRAGDIAAQ